MKIEHLSRGNPCTLCGSSSAKHIKHEFIKRWPEHKPYGDPCETCNLAASSHRVRKKRNKSPKRIRTRKILVLKLIHRDGSRCRVCHFELGNDITLDHIFWKVAGGPDTLDNLQLAHFRCNAARRPYYEPPPRLKPPAPRYSKQVCHLCKGVIEGFKANSRRCFDCLEEALKELDCSILQKFLRKCGDSNEKLSDCYDDYCRKKLAWDMVYYNRLRQTQIECLELEEYHAHLLLLENQIQVAKVQLAKLELESSCPLVEARMSIKQRNLKDTYLALIDSPYAPFCS